MITYEIEYSKCRKTIGIIVERNKHIVVRAPEGYSPSKIAEIVASKKDWIESKLKDERKYPDQPQRKEFVSGESLMLLGHYHKLYEMSLFTESILMVCRLRLHESINRKLIHYSKNGIKNMLFSL